MKQPSQCHPKPSDPCDPCGPCGPFDLMQPWVELATTTVSAVWRFNCRMLQLNAELLTGMGKVLGKMGEQCECAPKQEHCGDKPDKPEKH